MNRREFIKTSAGSGAVLVSPGVYSIITNCNSIDNKKSFPFRDYQTRDSMVPVKIVTPNDGYYIHTFFDICPFSPSQKYLAVTKLPYQHREAQYGDKADVCIIDLENETIEKVYSTKGWGYQLGANLDWGAKSDRYLYTNDIIDNQAVCVRIDIETREIKAFAGPKYHISPDETEVIGFPLDIINGYQDGKPTQMGYGVPKFREVDEIEGAPSDQGLWKTNLETNKKMLLVSLNEAYNKINNPYYADANCYFFHSKYNKQGTRILQVFRGIFPGSSKYHPTLITFNPDGSDIREAVTQKQWSGRGSHPNWHPDGENILMNLTPEWLGENEMRFCMFHYTGKDFKILSNKHLGSGHPIIDPDTKYLITDCYQFDPMVMDNGHVPIRFINLNTGKESTLCSVFTDLDISENTFRVDPHPAWSRDYKKVCFNGAPEGVRQVFVADLTTII